MRSILKACVFGGWMACTVVISAQKPQASQTATPAKKATQSPTNSAAETRGELKFQQNCSRCHNAPQELSSRISETVVMHMRVRASLSEKDAQAILRYLAP